MLTRRAFHLGLTSAAFAGFALQGCREELSAATLGAKGYGKLIGDEGGLLDLPKGFSYRIISQLGDGMADGYSVPDKADGMGAFDMGGGMVALVRNHEIRVSDLEKQPWMGGGKGPASAYDRTLAGVALPGGTTTMMFNMKSGRVESQYRSLAGTIRNCAGGSTPWNSWLTCEEDVTRGGATVGQDHGWIFEVPAGHKGLVTPVALKDMGRFNHEAAAVDPRTGIVYLTEDEKDGLFYRFLPNTKSELAKGGRLQALVLKGAPNGSDTRNWNSVTLERGKPKQALWIDADGVDNLGNDMRLRLASKGAALFARGEGIHFGQDELYFTCTSGGVAQAGQVMRYRPSKFEGQADEKDAPGTVEVFFESAGKHQSDYADNLTIAPNGHLIICEDQGGDGPVDNHLRGIAPTGAIYPIARLRTQTELAGVCFSPDGSTLFVNVYQPAKTLAITGPWGRVRVG